MSPWKNNKHYLPEVIHIPLLKEEFTKIIKSTFVRNVLTIVSGAAVAQIITIAFAPIITRIYGPEAFGVFGVFMSIVGIFTPIVALTYPVAIVLPKEDEDAKALVRISIYVAITMSTTIFLLLIFFYQPIGHYLQITEIRSYLVLIPFFMFFSATTQVAQQWLIRKRQFYVRAKIDVIQAIIVNIGKTCAGLISPIATVLILIASLGQALYAMMLTWGARFVTIRDKREDPDKTITSSNLLEIAKHHYDFPLYRAPEAFINGVSQSLPVLLLSSFFGPVSAGFYVIGITVLSLPSQLISHSVGDVFYPHIAEASKNNENLTPLIAKATLGLAAIGFIPFGIVVVLGPWLFGFVFGADWIIAGEYARWLALWIFFGFCNIPSVKAIPVLSAQLFLLIFSILTLIIRLATLAIGSFVFMSDKIAIALFGISGAVLYIVLILVTLLISKQYDGTTRRNISFTNERNKL